jgi:hypothetical protein
MKKLLSMTAVMAALSTPAAAAEVTIGGDFEYYWKDTAGTSSSNVDADINIKPKTVTEDGLTIQADININQDGEHDGGNSLTLSKGIWAIDLGDTHGALDSIDDVTDFTYQLGNGSPSVDHAAKLTVKPIDGLTVHASIAGDSNYGTSATAGHALAAKYSMGPVTLGAGMLDNDDGTEAKIMNASVAMGNFGLAAERYTDTTAAGVDTDTTTYGGTFKVNKTKFGVEFQETESESTVSSENIVYGVHHKLAEGLTGYVEHEANQLDSEADITVVGLAFKF